MRAVAKLSPLKSLMSQLGDKSLRPHLDALADLLLQVPARAVCAYVQKTYNGLVRLLHDSPGRHRCMHCCLHACLGQPAGDAQGRQDAV